MKKILIAASLTAVTLSVSGAAFAAEPELKTAGWLPEVPLSELIFHDGWGAP